MKAYWKMDVRIHIFFTSALAGGEWSASRPGGFTSEEGAPGTHWIGGWVDPRAGLDDVENKIFLTLPGLELRPVDRPASSQSHTDDTIPAPNTLTIAKKRTSLDKPEYMSIWVCLPI
jgi:hypothetical protein